MYISLLPYFVYNISVLVNSQVFAVIRCKGSYKVMTMHQERPVTLPGCPEAELCPLDLMQDLYSESLQECNFDQMCDIHSWQ